MTPTSFQEIYDVFLSNIDDVTFISADTDNSLKKRYLLNAIPRFRRCKSNLANRNDSGEVFNISLTDEEKLILGLLMVVEYLNPQILSLKNLRQGMSNRDFQQTSQASHLKQLSDIQKAKQADVNKLIVDYTYNNADLGELR